MKLPDTQTIIEQLALLFASLVWTIVVLSAIALFWLYQDVQARWDFVMNAPPEALAQAGPTLPPTATPMPTPTLWPGPGPTATPTATSPPTPTATWVIPPPNILPETLNPDDPTPIPVEVRPEVTVEGLIVEPTSAPVEPSPTPAPATPTPTPEPTQELSGQPVQQPTPTIVIPTNTPTSLPLPPTATPIPTPPPVASIPDPPADGQAPTRLVISSVNIDSPIIPVGWRVVEQNNRQYSIWDVADYAVGWHKTTPVLGQPGNTVMAGHHNINGEVFRDLVNVEVGDQVVVYSGQQKFEYVVELKTIVKEKGESIEVRQRNAQWIAPTTDERLTFITCWPYTNNTHRVIVVAKPL